MSQTAVNINQPVGINGSFADSGPKDVATFASIEKVPFGQMISRVSGSDNKGKLPSTASDITNSKNVAGVAVSDQARESKEDGLPAGYEKEDAVSTLREGRIYVKVEDAVTPASDVFVRFQGRQQIQTIVFDAALITGNLVDGDVNGIPITQVPFDTDNATTLTNLAAEIQLQPEVATAVSNGTETITVTTVQDGDVSLTNFIVTAGASQAGTTIAETQSGVTTFERGAFRSDNAGGLAAQLSNAQFRSSAAAGELAVLEIDV